MPRRQSDLMTLCCPIGPRERIACDDMRAVLALDNDREPGQDGAALLRGVRAWQGSGGYGAVRAQDEANSAEVQEASGMTCIVCGSLSDSPSPRERNALPKGTPICEEKL